MIIRCLASLIALVTVSTAQSLNCVLGQFSEFDEVNKKVICRQCPADCDICQRENKVLKCLSCTKGHFLNGQGECNKCVEGCNTCYGGDLKLCQTTLPGYFYKEESKSLQKCPDNCSTCNAQGECTECMIRTLPIKLLSQNGDPLKRDNHQLVKCEACKDPNCQACSLTPYFTQSCYSCKHEFGLHPQTHLCVPCSAGCGYCERDATVCQFCKSNYNKNVRTGMCEPVKVENCISQNRETGDCDYCAQAFTLVKTDHPFCAACASIDPACIECGEDRENKMLIGAIKCLTCEFGYSWSTKDKKCMKCEDNCLLCQYKKNTTEIECHQCISGYYPKDGKCVKNTLPNCSYSPTGAACLQCKTGFYLAEGICKPCHESCITCDGPAEAQCIACSTISIVYKNSTEAKMMSIPFYDVVDSRLFGHRSCLKTCPKTNYENEPLVLDSFSRICEPTAEEKVIIKKKYEFSRSPEATANNLYIDSRKYVVSYLTYYQALVKEHLEWAARTPDIAKLYSAQCNYRGKLEEKINAHLEAHYECKCAENFYGPNCFMPRDLHTEILEFLHHFNSDLQQVAFRVMEPRVLYAILENILHGTVGLDALEDVVKTMDTFHSRRQFTTNDPMGFLRATDAGILSHYREKCEIVNSLGDKVFEIEYMKELNNLYDLLHDMIGLASDVIMRSQADMRTPLTMTPTVSFQLVAITPDEDTFKENGKTVSVSSPDILSLGHSLENLEVKLVLDLPQAPQLYPVNFWYYSSLLFPHMPNKGFFAAEMVSIYIWDALKKAPLLDTVKATNYVLIKFPLKIVPIEADLKKEMKCISISYSKGITEQLLETVDILSFGVYESGKSFITCKFTQPKVWNHFYTVGYVGAGKNFVHEKIYRSAMDEADSFNILEFKTPPMTLNNAAQALAAIVLALCLTIFI